jgi:hypothetical protein
MAFIIFHCLAKFVQSQNIVLAKIIHNISIKASFGRRVMPGGGKISYPGCTYVCMYEGRDIVIFRIPLQILGHYYVFLLSVPFIMFTPIPQGVFSQLPD